MLTTFSGCEYIDIAKFVYSKRSVPELFKMFGTSAILLTLFFQSLRYGYYAYIKYVKKYFTNNPPPPDRIEILESKLLTFQIFSTILISLFIMLYPFKHDSNGASRSDYNQFKYFKKVTSSETEEKIKSLLIYKLNKSTIKRPLNLSKPSHLIPVDIDSVLYYDYDTATVYISRGSKDIFDIELNYPVFKANFSRNAQFDSLVPSVTFKTCNIGYITKDGVNIDITELEKIFEMLEKVQYCSECKVWRTELTIFKRSEIYIQNGEESPLLNLTLHTSPIIKRMVIASFEVPLQ